MGFWFLICLLFLLSSSLLVIELANSQPLCHDQEKLALLHFKQSFVINCGLAYNPTTSYPKTNSWKSDDCCSWDGVKCDDEIGHVIELDLSNSCLYGTFPHESALFGLDHLLELNLSGNNFNYSQIPFAISRLNMLTSLNLSKSFFSGQIPLEITNLSSLSLLDLSYNGDPSGGDRFGLELHDPGLDELVRGLTRLSVLRLDKVDISSIMPFSFSNLTLLRVISLVDCSLFGVFPTSVLERSNVEELTLDYNYNLGGYLPEFHPNTPLKTLSLRSTSFSGELPPSIGKLDHLETLNLWSSHFSGSIPSSLGNLTKLTVLDLEYNDFTGQIPSSVQNLTQLVHLGLSNFNISPENLSSWLLKLNKLTTLGLNNMNLGGKIPFVLTNLTKLTHLDLYSNQIRGPLPNWLGNLTELITLRLDGNQLQGPIPEWFSQLTNLRNLYLFYNDTNSESTFDTFLKLPNLYALYLGGVNLKFPPYSSANYSSLPKLDAIGLEFGKLNEFPQFLRDQNELQALSLKGNNISGTIPQWLVNATRENLLLLELSDNFLTGFEEPSVYLPWSRLELLDYSSNKLQGKLPSPPTSMIVYKATDNQFSGGIPEQVCEASFLILLDLSINNMSGIIPDCIGSQLSGSLTVLNLRGNNFQGTIPRTFSRSCRLTMINLSQNQLEGELPRSLANCELLEILDIGRNRVNDTFPSWLGNLPKLQVLVLGHNNFHGKIEASHYGGEFPSLRIIDLSYNFHTGALPAKYLREWHAMEVESEDQSDSSNILFELHIPILQSVYTPRNRYDYSITITNKGSETLYSKILVVFRVIDFSCNNFTGKIPDLIGNLKGLQALNLSNNHLEGLIPSSLAMIRDLEALDLSQNILSGEIPQELTQLTYLEVFNVSHNLLRGPIPQGQQFNTFGNSSFYGNLALCGATLGKKCGKIDSPTSTPTTNDDTEENSELIDWIVRSLGCVTGLIVGYVIGKIYIADKHHDWFMETFARRRTKTRVRAQSQRSR